MQHALMGQGSLCTILEWTDGRKEWATSKKGVVGKRNQSVDQTSMMQCQQYLIKDNMREGEVEEKGTRIRECPFPPWDLHSKDDVICLESDGKSRCD